MFTFVRTCIVLSSMYFPLLSLPCTFLYVPFLFRLHLFCMYFSLSSSLYFSVCLSSFVLLCPFFYVLSSFVTFVLSRMPEHNSPRKEEMTSSAFLFRPFFRPNFYVLSSFIPPCTFLYVFSCISHLCLLTYVRTSMSFFLCHFFYLLPLFITRYFSSISHLCLL